MSRRDPLDSLRAAIGGSDGSHAIAAIQAQSIAATAEFKKLLTGAKAVSAELSAMLSVRDLQKSVGALKRVLDSIQSVKTKTELNPFRYTADSKALEALRSVPPTATQLLAARWPERNDLLAVLNHRRPQGQRMEAARRIAKRLGKVIHQKRWKWVLKEMKDRARLHRSSPQKEFEELIVGSLFDVIKCIGALWNIDDCYASLKKELNAVATEDALGPDWRKRTGAQSLRQVQSKKSERAIDSGIAEIEAKLTAELLTEKAKLSKLERQVFLKHHLEDKTLRRISTDLKKTPDTVKQAYFQAKQKVKKILKPS